ncbi:MAG: excinuclease ABC subunit UvrC [Candidatus Dormiibacterota bacterium]
MGGPRPGETAVAGGPGRVHLLERPDLLRARLKAVPAAPGVYLFRDEQGQVAYVGKSANLRDRLRSYFAAPRSHPARIGKLVASAVDFEVVATGTEQEALILENTLIKRHRPRFNVRLRDDKNYLYVRIPQALVGTGAPETPAERLEAYPRPEFSRRIRVDGARYFGPYTDSGALRRSVRELRAAVPFRGCPDAIFRRRRICLDFHLGICAGPCEGRISPLAHRELLEQAAEFLEGRTGAVRAELERSMGEASAQLDFERAAALRDRVRAIDRLTSEQATVPRTGGAVDVVGMATHGGSGMAAVLLVREGRVQAAERYPLDGLGDVEPAEAISSFVAQHYAASPSVPARVVLPFAVPDERLLQEYLEGRRGGPVRLLVPQRGHLVAISQLARQTAEAALEQSRVSQDFDPARAAAVLAELADLLGMSGPPRRIECYDISNTMGEQSVGSMVVFEEARPKPADYRIFGIKDVEGPNDFASMEEVIGRRFRHLAAAGEESLGRRPDLVIVDGGEGQLAAAHRALTALGLESIPHFGLAKRFEELHKVGGGEPVHLARGSASLFLVQRVRDEAHRFAITRHRARRQRAGLRSRLDEVRGLGPKRKRALLSRFGSLQGIKEASLEELIAVPGVTRPVAAALKEIL